MTAKEQRCVSSEAILFILYYILFRKFTVVWTRAQVDTLSREELIEEMLMFSDITDQLNGLNCRLRT